MFLVEYCELAKVCKDEANECDTIMSLRQLIYFPNRTSASLADM
jgi:hypothetical protein